MAGTVTTDLQFFTGAGASSYSNCDAITDWLVAPTLSTTFYYQNTGSCSLKVSNGLSTSVFTLLSSVDLTGKILYVWMFMSELKKLATEANGGLRIRIEDASANWREWYVGGLDTYMGGWKCFARRADFGWTTQSATAPTITAITKVGVACNTTAVATVVNFWWDALRYGTGVTIKGGTSTPGDEAKFDDIITAEELIANKWGVVSKVEGAYLIQGKLNFGSTTGGEATYFKDIDKLILFCDRPFSTFYSITLQGNATAITQVFFGVKSGTAGISGCGFYSAGASKYTLTATDTNITNFGFYGCTFFDASTITLSPYSVNKEVLNCNFSKCSEVLANTNIITNCNFISSTGRAVRISSASHYVTSSNFINCQTAIHHDIGGAVGTPLEYDYDKLMFTGGTYHIENSATTPDYYIDIDRLNGSNPDVAKINNSNGGTTTLLALGAVNTTVTVKTSDTPPVAIQYARVLVLAATDGPMPYDVTVTIVNSGTTATVTHTAHSMATDDKVQIKGASLQANNGVFIITKINVDSYSYTMTSTPGSSPTGTIKATYTALFGLSDVNGVITMSRIFTLSQPISGRVRKSTGTPLYKTTDFIGTINSTTGFSTTIQMIPDV